MGGGRAWPGFETTHPATHSDTSAAGVEGAGGHGGPGCGARGRRQGLAGLRGDAPSHTQRHKRRRCGGRRRARARFEPTHQSASATGRHWVERPDTQAAVPMLVTATQAPPVWRVPEGQAAVPVGGAEPGRTSHSNTSAAGAEGAGGPGCGARGRRQGLAGLRDDAPSHTQRHKRRRCDGRRRARRARAGFEIDHSEPQARVWRSRGRPGPTAPGTPAAPQARPSAK